MLKNRWLAEKLGGAMYSVVFKYERPKGAAATKANSSEEESPCRMSASPAK